VTVVAGLTAPRGEELKSISAADEVAGEDGDRRDRRWRSRLLNRLMERF